MNSLISIVVPVYNNIHFLKEAMNSLKIQTYKNFEVIVVNDGSFEIKKIRKIINFFKKDFKTYLINYKNNKGVSYALNKGIKKSKGKYISWLSHDDYFHPNKLLKQINSIKKNEEKIVFTSFYQVDENRNIKKTKKYKKFLFEYKYHILFRDDINLSTALFSKKIFKKVGYFDLKKKHTQDYDMMFKMFKKFKVEIINEPLFYSRQHKKQTSKIQKNDVYNEKKNFILLNINKISRIFERSNIFKKSYIVFFLRLKNICEVNTRIKKLIFEQNFFINLTLQFVYVISRLFLLIRKV